MPRPRLSANGKPRRRPARTVDVNRVLSRYQSPDIHVSPIQLDEAGTEVLRFPLKPKNRKTSKMVELVVSSGIQLSDSLNLPEIMVPALVDTGAQIEVLAGEELFPSAALIDAPHPVQLVTVGRKPLSGGRKGVLSTVRVPVETPEGLRVFKCVQVFIHVAAIGPRLILGFPFLLRYGLAVVPGRDALVSLDSFQRRRKPAYQHGGMSEYALEVAGAHIQAEYSTELLRPRYFKWVAPDITLQSCLSGKQHVDKRTTKARRSSDATTAPTVSFLDNKLEYFQSDCVNTRCHRPAHLVWDHIGQVPTAGMCFWCFQRSFGEPEPDWTPQGLAQRRKGVSYEPRRSISETKVITIPSLSRSLANLQGVVDLSAYTNEQRPPTPTRRPRRPSIPIPPSATESPANQQSFGPATAAPSSESAGQEVSLPPSPPLSSPLSPPCMSPTLVELIQAHISSNPLRVKQVRPESILPTKGTPGSAGYDVYAAADILIPSGGQQRVPTGLAFTTPALTYGKIQDRSGNASKLALRVGAGVIDHDYTGEVDILLSNQAPRDHMVRQGDKVAQMTLELHLNPLVQPVSELQATERGSGGFGSTDTPKGTVPPSPGKPHPPSQEEGVQISPVSSSTLTLLSPSRAQEYVLLVCTYLGGGPLGGGAQGWHDSGGQ